MKTKYIIQDREAGNFITDCNTMEEAKMVVEAYYAQDILNDCLVPDFYEIKVTGSMVGGEWTKGEWVINSVETLHFDIGICMPLVKDNKEMKHGFSFKKICRCDYDFENTKYSIPKEQAEANANRIVQCVNGYDKLKADNGALVSALKRIEKEGVKVLEEWTRGKEIDFKTICGAMVEVAQSALNFKP